MCIRDRYMGQNKDLETLKKERDNLKNNLDTAMQCVLDYLKSCNAALLSSLDGSLKGHSHADQLSVLKAVPREEGAYLESAEAKKLGESKDALTQILNTSKNTLSKVSQGFSSQIPVILEAKAALEKQSQENAQKCKDLSAQVSVLDNQVKELKTEAETLKRAQEKTLETLKKCFSASREELIKTFSNQKEMQLLTLSSMDETVLSSNDTPQLAQAVAGLLKTALELLGNQMKKNQELTDSVSKLEQGFNNSTKLSARENQILSHFSVERRLCLLYTSPSPRDGLLSRMPSSA
eukprot:TRINITY_DN7393_c0_g1_i2.p1 TRINITY_DN7393_c0_g1~~TRINITY_DN7393_c0_g1_i2.p1  ORF type:complete len:293 (-),score=68.87 TRINITY_DN7393_c0_g1_i2:24-902(-)